MKRWLAVIPFLVFFLLIPLSNASAGSESPKPVDEGVLCLPGIYMSAPGNCVSAGPSAYLTSMAEQGFTFPVTPSYR